MQGLLRLLEMIVRLLEQAIEKRRQRTRQAQRDELESDPVGFFDAHFDGLRDEPAHRTDKTDP